MVQRFAVCLLVVLLFASATVFTQDLEKPRPWWATTAISVHGASHAFDMISTSIALQSNPNATEMNPVLRPFMDNPVAFKAVSISLWVGANYTLWKMSKTHPKRATILAVALSAAEIAIASHNLSVANDQPTYPPRR